MSKKDEPSSKLPRSADPKMEHEYGHSSGDRNTRTKAHEWTLFKDGKAHKEDAEPPRRTDTHEGRDEERSG